MHSTVSWMFACIRSVSHSHILEAEFPVPYSVRVRRRGMKWICCFTFFFIWRYYRIVLEMIDIWHLKPEPSFTLLRYLLAPCVDVRLGMGMKYGRYPAYQSKKVIFAFLHWDDSEPWWTQYLWNCRDGSIEYREQDLQEKAAMLSVPYLPY